MSAIDSAARDAPAPRRRLLLANPRGFCAGVTRAIAAVEDALARFGAPVYVRRHIVHNQGVVDRLSRLGAVFVRELAEVPPGALVILSAHGVPRRVVREAAVRQVRALDATCPLVAKIHGEVARHHRAGRHVLLVGHPGHPEIVGTLGQLPDGAISVVASAEGVAGLALARDAAVAFAVQTTFSVQEAAGIVAAIRRRFADVAAPRSSDICYATTNRQAAIAAIAAQADCVLVVGDALSSNARRLTEVARAAGCASVALVDGAAALGPVLPAGAMTVGLTAAASTPPEAVAEVCARLEVLGFAVEEVAGRQETAAFRPVAMTPIGEPGRAARRPAR
jgi:(E)-4-hydroxy-3-methyl-but-2-enyl pyrophosphate reductase